MSTKQFLKPNDFFERQLPKGLLLFLKAGHKPMAVWLTNDDTSFAAEVKKEAYEEVVYVLREELQGLVATLNDLKIKSRGKIVPNDQGHLVRVYGEGRLQLSKDEGHTPKAVKAPAAAVRKASKLKVLVVDDSHTMRTLLEKCLKASDKFEIVGSTGEPRKVKDLLKELKPDVMTLDIHMPDMNGIELWQSLSAEERVPTVLVSSLSMEEGSLVIQGLELGAFDYIKKPAANELKKFGEELSEKLELAGASRAKTTSAPRRGHTKSANLSLHHSADKNILIAIGASTGGTEAIKEMICRWPANIPPILIVQHIPPYFSRAFANRLNELCAFEVKEAEDGDEVRPGRALVAPGGLQMSLVGRPGNYKVSVAEGEPMSGHKPSVDFLFHSVAKLAKAGAIGIIMTGMGKDGAAGLLEMHKQGAFTIGQDEETSVVYGMPKAAFMNGSVELQLPLEEMAAATLEALGSEKRGHKKKPA